MVNKLQNPGGVGAAGRHCFPVLALAMLLPQISYSTEAFDAPTAAECRHKVEARYRESHVQGSPGMPIEHRNWFLRECDRNERLARNTTMFKARERLTAAIETLRQGGAISAETRKVLMADHEKIVSFPPSDDREACLRLHNDFLRYETLASVRSGSANRATYRCAGPDGRTEFRDSPCQGGAAGSETVAVVQEPAAPPSPKSCAEARALIASAKQTHDDAVTALLPRKGADGKVIEDPAWRTLDRQRLAALSEWRWQRDRAQAMGCPER